MRHIIILLFAALALSAQGQAISDTLSARLDMQRYVYPQEKIHLTTDKSSYVSGDTLWLRAWVVDAATHQPVSASRYVYVELQSPTGKIIRRSCIEVKNNMYAGALLLPADMAAGNYTLAAYTSFMQRRDNDYICRRLITVGNAPTADAAKNLSVMFRPEGGNLVGDVACKVAFCAVGADGLERNITGYVADASGKRVSKFKTLLHGVGYFTLVPHRGETYTAVCRDNLGNESSVALPPVGDDACTLQLDNSKKASFSVSAIGSLAPGCRMVLQQRGVMLYAATPKAGTPFTFSRADFAPGVVQILLIDPQYRNLSERLIYVPASAPQIAVTPDKAVYSSGERAKIKVKLSDFAKPAGTYSVAVTDDANSAGGDIAADLLFISDLNDNIACASMLFTDNATNAEAARDAYMMTRQWSRYDVAQALAGKYSEPAAPLEIGQAITGIVKNSLTGSPMSGVLVRLVSYPDNTVSTSCITDNAGRFSLDRFDVAETSVCVVQAVNLTDNSAVAIEFDPVKYPGYKPLVTAPARDADASSPVDAAFSALGVTGIETLSPATSLQGLRKVRLENVVKDLGSLSAGGLNISYQGKPVVFLVGGEYNNKIRGYSQPIPEGSNSRQERLSKTNDMMANAGYGKYSEERSDMTLRLAIPSGAQTSTPAAGTISVGRVCLYDIQSVEVLISPAGKLLVSDSPLSILKTSWDGKTDVATGDVRIVPLLGYQAPTDFSASQSATRHKASKRSTIYWNPSVKVNSHGDSSFQFFTGDSPATTLTVRIEGVTESGEIIHASTTLKKN